MFTVWARDLARPMMRVWKADVTNTGPALPGPTPPDSRTNRESNIPTRTHTHANRATHAADSHVHRAAPFARITVLQEHPAFPGARPCLEQHTRAPCHIRRQAHSRITRGRLVVTRSEAAGVKGAGHACGCPVHLPRPRRALSFATPAASSSTRPSLLRSAQTLRHLAPLRVWGGRRAAWLHQQLAARLPWRGRFRAVCRYSRVADDRATTPSACRLNLPSGPRAR